MQTQLAMIEVTEALIDRGERDLWEQLEPTARNLETAIPFLAADLDFERVRGVVEELSREAALLVQSYKWSRLILQAMLDAAEVVLAIETGGRMGGIGPALQRQVATAGVARGVGTALSAAQLERLLAGATVVAMAASKRDPQKERRRGIRSEIGEGLSPNRPRVNIGSITGTASARYPDRVLLRYNTFWELKNVLNLRLTWQLADFMVYAQTTGMKMVLYIRPTIKGSARAGTKLSPSLREAIKILRRDGLIEIRYLKKY
jgi:hypothetical protein